MSNHETKNEIPEVVFNVSLSHFKITDVNVHHKQVKEKLHLNIEFERIKLHTPQERVITGSVEWNFSRDFEFAINELPDLSVKTILKSLIDKKLKISVCCQHDEEILGTVVLDLCTASIGPTLHNLPIIDVEHKVVGRLQFNCTMAETREIMFSLLEVNVQRLNHKGITNLNPYLKYGYTKEWPSILVGAETACYSDVAHHTDRPKWPTPALPPLTFWGTLLDLQTEGIILHITHSGTLTNVSLCGGKISFKTLIASYGEDFRENLEIKFSGIIHSELNVQIEGTCKFSNLPRFAPMKPIFPHKPALHTEKGIFDAAPRYKYLPVPDIPITITEEQKENENEKIDRHVEEVAHDPNPREKGRRSPILGSPSVPREPPTRKKQPMPDLIEFSPVNQRSSSQTNLL